MKHSTFKVLIIGIVAAGVTVPLFAQSPNPWLQQWYRAKYGRSLPAEVAQRTLTQHSDPAVPVKAARATFVPANTWFENWYRAKYGRPSPLEPATRRPSARLQNQRNPVNNWFDRWYQDKYGRPSPRHQRSNTR